jgi:peptidoglycan hydrolase CwlO-like protein
MSVHRVNIDNFIVSKLNEEAESIEKDIENLGAIKDELEHKISDHRKEIENSEKELDEVNDSISILRENRSVIKEKVEVIKKENN